MDDFGILILIFIIGAIVLRLSAGLLSLAFAFIKWVLVTFFISIPRAILGFVIQIINGAVYVTWQLVRLPFVLVLAPLRFLTRKRRVSPTVQPVPAKRGGMVQTVKSLLEITYKLAQIFGQLPTLGK